MKQSIAHIALVVKDYDEAIEFYTQKLHFELIEDTYQPLTGCHIGFSTSFPKKKVFNRNT